MLVGGSKEGLKLAEVGEDPVLALQVQRPHCAVGYGCVVLGSLKAPSSLSFQGKECHVAPSGAWQRQTGGHVVQIGSTELYRRLYWITLPNGNTYVDGIKHEHSSDGLETPCICARITHYSPEQPCYAMLTQPFVF